MRPPFSSVAKPACVLALVILVSDACSTAARASTADSAAVTQIANPAERIAFLRAEIARHNELYYRQSRPEISDFEYDALKAELAELERRFPDEAARLGPSPMRDLGDDRSAGFPKYKHRERMLSLEKTTNEAGLRGFDQRVRKLLGEKTAIAYVVEPKFDGVAISATYEHGRLVRVVTRGDGDEGDDVTAAARRIRLLPATLTAVPEREFPRSMEVRGEVYLSFAEFDRINRACEEASEERYSSPRNLAAGTLKSTDARELERRELEVVFYGLGAVDADTTVPARQTELPAWLESWGLPAVENARLACSIDEVTTAVGELGQFRAKLPYPIDGAVVKLDSMAGQRAAGATPSAPRWAIAFKYAPQRASTRLKAIVLQVGRTGVITPVAELEPVKLAGATIGRATLHNATQIARRDIRIGDTVFVERLGEIVPAVVGVDLERRDAASRPFAFPRVCPGCGEGLSRKDGQAAWRCLNRNCPAQLRRRVQHFASSEGVAIKGLGESTVDVLVERGMVRRISDLYRLRADDLMSGFRLSEKSSEALIGAIERTKRAPLWRVMNGLGIPGVGPVGAKALARCFGSLDALAAAREDELREVERIGAESAHDIAAFLAEEPTRKLFAELVALGVEPRNDVNATGPTPLEGKLFVLTGTLPTLSRARAAELIEAAGGRIGSTVTRRTHYVVAGAEAGAKLDRAKALGVAVIDEPQLMNLLGELQER